MNTKLYKELLEIRRNKGVSIRELAEIAGISRSTMTNFFDTNTIFRPFTEVNIGKLHNNLGISYDVIEDYNKFVMEERKKNNGDDTV